jgi:hypothetical protein
MDRSNEVQTGSLAVSRQGAGRGGLCIAASWPVALSAARVFLHIYNECQAKCGTVFVMWCSITRLTKNFFSQYYPDAFYAARAWRMRRYFRRSFLRRQSQMKFKIYGDGTPSVLSGPFAGMKYLNEVCWGPIEPKWLGCYEQELHPLLKLILDRKYARIVDVGSAEGYYAVGLAMKLPTAQVYSFEIDPWARAQQRRLAALNGVRNITIGKLCAPNNLQSYVPGQSLLICDIEGGEYELLNPVTTSALLEYDILVELHDAHDLGLTIKSGAQEVTRRFSASHRITEVKVSRRKILSFSSLVGCKLTDDELTLCINEFRPREQVWLWLQARQAMPLSPRP